MYTDKDMAAVEAAIIELALGKRVERLSIAGKEVNFAPTQMDNLLKLKSIIAVSLGHVSLRTYAKNGGRG